MNRRNLIRQALEDLELIKLCQLIVDKEVIDPIYKEVTEVFELASRKRGHVPGFYRIQAEYNGISNEEE